MRVLYMMPAARGVYPAEAERRREQLIRSYATADLHIDIAYQPEASGFQPWGGVGRPGQWEAAQRAYQLAAEVARQAQADGYDAFCPFGLLDVGVEEGRRLGLTIPLVGAAESSALLCGLLGRRFAGCRYVRAPGPEERERTQVVRWGVAHLYVGSTSIDIPNDEYPDRRDEVLERFVACAQQAKQMGAEVMGLVGMSICPLEFSAKELAEVAGLPVIDAIAAQLTIASLWHRTGLPPSLLRVPRSSA